MGNPGSWQELEDQILGNIVKGGEVWRSDLSMVPAGRREQFWKRAVAAAVEGANLSERGGLVAAGGSLIDVALGAGELSGRRAALVLLVLERSRWEELAAAAGHVCEVVAELDPHALSFALELEEALAQRGSYQVEELFAIVGAALTPVGARA